MPFFGAFGGAWDEAMVARWSANPLGMLCPELGARMAANVAVTQDPAGNLKPAKDKSTSGSMASSPPSWRSAVPWSSRTSPARVLHVLCVSGERCHHARDTKERDFLML